MTFDDIVQMALEQKATDIHLEPRLPIVFRINGSLRRGPSALSSESLRAIADRLLPDEAWDEFQARGSYDLTRKVSGVQCRINVMKSDRGIGLAVRLLSTSTNTLRSCNLHSQLGELIERDSGLILICGPTGSGKSTTLAAMIEEINMKSAKHVITLESPIEYRFTPKKSIIRQREVGVHTPSYEQGLLDSLREDPDVIVVGEMRDSESMRWTLNAAETGHLVLATMHSSNAADAVYRMMMSFPPERQTSVLAQLADSLIAIVSQRMSFRAGEGLLVPTLEILIGTHAAKHTIRKGEASKLQSVLQAGGPEGSWTFERYQQWLDTKTDWAYPEPPVPGDSDVDDVDEADEVSRPERRRDSSSKSHLAPRSAKPPIDRDFEETESLVDPAAQAAAEAFVTSSRSEFSSEDSNEDQQWEEKESPVSRASRVPKWRPAPSLGVRANEISSPSRSQRKAADKKAQVRIHKDGRIEIPEMDLDLNDLVKEFGDKDER